jgi:hypothetical protein
MASQVSPGIVLKERDLSNAVVTGAQQVTAAIASTFAKGPINTIVNVSTEKEFRSVFGDPTSANAEDWFVASEYLNYGGRLAVVRAETGTLNATSGEEGVLVQNDIDWESGSGNAYGFVARSAGTWANAYRVAVVDRGADYILTLETAPTTAPAQGDAVSLSDGTNEETGVVLNWTASTKKLEVILDDPTATIVATDWSFVSEGDNITITAAQNWYLNTKVQGTEVFLSQVGPRPGTSEFASAKGIKYDEVHVVVIDKNSNIVERFLYLSKLTDAKSPQGNTIYYKTAINLQSQNIFVGSGPSTTVDPSSTGAGEGWGQASSALASGDRFALSANLSTSLTNGTDDYAYTVTEISDAYDLFLDTEEVVVDFILMGGSMATEANTKSKASKVIALATERKDCVAFVSAHKGNQIGTTEGALTSTAQRDNTIAFFNGLTSSSYAVFDSGYKYFYDRFNDSYRYIPCNGDVAGLCVATSATLDDWYSPAGLNRGSLRSAIKLAFNPNKADRDALYQNRINPIVSFPGSGVTLFGDKTALSSPSAFDRINVRRLFLNVEKRVGNLAKQILFEQNDVSTRSSFSSAVNSYLNEVQSRRGITDFLVVCDETNNTPDVIDRNEFVAELFIKPTRSINYITITFTATKTGVSFNEVIGQ